MFINNVVMSVVLELQLLRHFSVNFHALAMSKDINWPPESSLAQYQFKE